MRKFALLLVAAVFSISLHAGLLNAPMIKQGNVEIVNPLGFKDISKLDVNAFLSLTPTKFKEITGRKLTLPQKVSLRIAQYEVKRQLKKGKSVDMALMSKKAESNIDILWLLLGIVLGLIGVLIALITQKGKDDNRVRSALIGWLIWLVIFLLVIL